ncbi:MAG: serine hydrolase [Bacteroidia bacterium]|nr:serine hydrolase [Bacteroidia bacterium]
MKIFLSYLTTVIILTQYSNAQTFDVTLATKLQTTIDSMKIANNIKGISASVIYPGQGMWKGVTGDSYSGLSITSDMEFGIASNTKLFTGVIALKLAQSGLISLDDSLHNWLPTFANVDSNITIRQLLNHTSGLADVNSVIGYSDSILLNPYKIYTPSQVITWVGTPLFPAGTSWSYSNTNYLLAAMIAETSTGQSYGKILHDSILTPLQLDSTFLDVYDSIIGTISHPWQVGVDKNSTPRKALNSAAWSAGGMYSTSSEMAQWYWALMNGQVLNLNSFNELTTFVGSGNYSIGLYETSILGRIIWQHGGTIWGGYNSSMMYDTTTHAVICVLTNQNPAQAFLVAKQMLQNIISFNPVGVNEISPTQKNLAIVPNPTSGNVHVKIVGEKLQSIKVYNLTGELLLEHFTNDFSIANLPNGIYFINTQTTESTFINKLIKQ